VSGVHRCEKSRVTTATHTTYIVSKEDIEEEDEDQNDEQVILNHLNFFNSV
jgi:hypothetical protein